MNDCRGCKPFSLAHFSILWGGLQVGSDAWLLVVFLHVLHDAQPILSLDWILTVAVLVSVGLDRRHAVLAVLGRVPIMT